MDSHLSTTARRRSIDTQSLVQASGYVLSGCSQPLLVQWLRDSGLADAKAQLYMWFYYLGPALVILPMFFSNREEHSWPTKRYLVFRAIGISLFDTVSASMNYAGASLAGPLVFAVVYSSVTIWTAVFSRLLLGRTMCVGQWGCVVVVFLGLTVAARDSHGMGKSVWVGCILVLVGSMMHALTYIFCEAIMTVGPDVLTLTQNCGIQATVALTVLGIWQLVYTVPHWTEVIGQPVQDAGTTVVSALFLLVLFAFCNWVHSITFYQTLIYFPGGATSAGVMKGLQAALVFMLTDWVFCGRTGGDEMCFSTSKMISLFAVSGGVVGYGFFTQQNHKNDRLSTHASTRGGYESVDGTQDDLLENDLEIEAIK
jgi:drug/metabolite transporter (DMT)-like permease